MIDNLTSAEARELDAIVGDVLTEYSVLVSPFAVTPRRMAELRARERLIAAEIARDGVPL